jgi:hypothetical protein
MGVLNPFPALGVLAPSPPPLWLPPDSVIQLILCLAFSAVGRKAKSVGPLAILWFLGDFFSCLILGVASAGTGGRSPQGWAFWDS